MISFRRILMVNILVVTSVAVACSEEVKFRVHLLNAQSQFSAGAVFDVNRDGKLDVFSGGFWYEAPDWKKHTVREVEMIGDRYDDYSNLPLDVNGDGWTDVISVNYRSKSLYWVEHPGKSLGVWKKHIIDKPGASETGRLVDVDGDGQLDVLPNGMNFAAWYSYSVQRKDDGTSATSWQRHDLPPQIVGHGIGFGDVNGDGRADLVGSKGWLEAPKDRRSGDWQWHDEFKLDSGASIPVVVTDVDRDGDADLVWGNGHSLGVYWLEQTTTAGKRSWKRHVVDDRLSQAHSLLMADIDGDGRDDLIAGKRYFGHGGKDPGERDPLAIYWYQYDAKKQTWRRHVVSQGGIVGMDLDPKAFDVDGDGDSTC